LGISISLEVLNDVVRCVNWHLIDHLLTLNFGEKARGTVYLEASSVDNDTKAFQREVIKSLLSADSTLAAAINVKGLFEESGLNVKETEAKPL